MTGFVSSFINLSSPHRMTTFGAPQSERGSFAAVGTFKPGIEIWDVDIIDPLEPVRILGGEKALQGYGWRGREGGREKGGEGEGRATLPLTLTLVCGLLPISLPAYPLQHHLFLEQSRQEGREEKEETAPK